MARPLWHKEADKSRNRGSMSRHEGCVWCPDADAKTDGTIKLNSSQTPVAVLSLLYSTRLRDSPARSRYNLYTFHWRKFPALRPVSIELAGFLLTSIRISVSLKLSKAYRPLRKKFFTFFLLERKFHRLQYRTRSGIKLNCHKVKVERWIELSTSGRITGTLFTSFGSRAFLRVRDVYLPSSGDKRPCKHPLKPLANSLQPNESLRNER